MFFRGIFKSVLAMLMLVPTGAMAASLGLIIDFETFQLEGGGSTYYSVSPSGEAATAAGQGVIQNGFLVKPGPVNTSGFNDLHVYNAKTTPTSTGNLTVPYNGSTIVGSHDDLLLQRTDSGMFTLFSFDYAGYADSTGTVYEPVLTLTGIRNDGSIVTLNFTPDGIVDGAGGSGDFQTVTLDSTWVNLVKVDFTVATTSATSSIFAVDNINVTLQSSATPVPEPGTWMLFGLGMLAMMGLVRRRRS